MNERRPGTMDRKLAVALFMIIPPVAAAVAVWSENQHAAILTQSSPLSLEPPTDSGMIKTLREIRNSVIPRGLRDG